MPVTARQALPWFASHALRRWRESSQGAGWISALNFRFKCDTTLELPAPTQNLVDKRAEHAGEAQGSPALGAWEGSTQRGLAALQSHQADPRRDKTLRLADASVARPAVSASIYQADREEQQRRHTDTIQHAKAMPLAALAALFAFLPWLPALTEACPVHKQLMNKQALLSFWSGRPWP